jgi:RNA polymerase sigma-70 factor (ECF subfamily)
MTLDFHVQDLQDSVASSVCSERSSLQAPSFEAAPANMGRPDDQLLAKLIGDVAGGSSIAFSALHQCCRPWMMQSALRILHRPELAEEAVQEGMIKLWQRASQFYAPKGGARSWISAIARNQALDMLRQRKNMEISMDDDFDEHVGLVDGAQDLIEWADGISRISAVSDVMAVMPAAMRESVLMSCHQGYTHTEIAQQMQAPVGTVKAWIRRGLQRLRSAVDAGDISHFANA